MNHYDIIIIGTGAGGGTLAYRLANTQAFNPLMNRWVNTLKSIDCGETIIPLSLYFRKRIPLQGVAHQVGTCRFGEDPATSVLDISSLLWLWDIRRQVKKI